MQTYPARSSGPLGFRTPQDPAEVVDYVLQYRAGEWTPGAKRLGNWVLPSTPNGCSYRCVSAGVTADTEPEWSTEEGAEIEDGNVTWLVSRDNFLLTDGESILLSAWTASDGVTVGATSFNTLATSCMVSGFPDPAPTSFVLTNTITTSAGRTYRRSLRIRVAAK